MCRSKTRFSLLTAVRRLCEPDRRDGANAAAQLVHQEPTRQPIELKLLAAMHGSEFPDESVHSRVIRSSHQRVCRAQGAADRLTACIGPKVPCAPQPQAQDVLRPSGDNVRAAVRKLR